MITTGAVDKEMMFSCIWNNLQSIHFRPVALFRLTFLFAVSWETRILKLGYQIHEKTKHSMQRKQALLRDIHMRKQIIFILHGNETMSFYCLVFTFHHHAHQSLHTLIFKSYCTTQVRLTRLMSLAYSKTYGKCLCSLKTAINVVYVTIPHASNYHNAWINSTTSLTMAK